MATEIVLGDNGKPVIVQPSPLARYKIGILQFSVTETQYDDKTLEQFAAKKESYLKAEQAKAERQQEYQQRLMVTEKGLRQVAEITAEENQKKASGLDPGQSGGRSRRDHQDPGRDRRRAEGGSRRQVAG